MVTIKVSRYGPLDGGGAVVGVGLSYSFPSSFFLLSFPSLSSAHVNLVYFLVLVFSLWNDLCYGVGWDVVG